MLIESDAIVALVFFLCSCNESRIDINYCLECSGTLVKYANPQVKYKDRSGEERIILLQESDFKKNEKLT